MKISLDWLGDFIQWKETDPQTIADTLTMRVAEIEQLEIQGRLLDHCCVGEIVSVAKHPSADRLSLADVNTDKGVKRVVCGGSNVRQGQLVAFAHIGATVKWHGGDLMTLAPVKIRGEASEGMICAAEELELESIYTPAKEDGERPIVDLGRLGTFKAGAPLRDALGLTDTILHISNTAITHRPDLFSHLGFARECVAAGLATWKKSKKKTPLKFATTPLRMKIHTDNKELIPRYCACTLEVDSIGETPEWMKRRLAVTGWRPVCLPVDITNYVTMELGMPMHSFDAADIEGDVHMRTSKKGETLRTLDDVERGLPDGAIVLSDKQGIFDLLGIMGGLRSSTKPTTTQILLHAAIVDPVSIRRAIVATGHRTDASTVYEKGVPKIAAQAGFERALELFLELVPGAKITSRMDSWGDDGKAPSIKLSPDTVRSALGIDVSNTDIARILMDIGCVVKKGTGKAPAFTVTPPLHRLRDLLGPHDLIEEIGRLYGYTSVIPQMPSALLRIPERKNALHTMRDTAKLLGYLEIMPLSLVSPQLLKHSGFNPDDAVRIANPLGEQTSLMQPSVLPAMLEHAQRTLGTAGGVLKTLHWGHVFARPRNEKVELALLVTAKSDTTLIEDPFLAVKAHAEALLTQTGFRMEIVADTQPPHFAHPGRTAIIRVQGSDVGHITEIHPSVRDHFDLPARAAAAIIDISCLLRLQGSVKKAASLPLFPAVTYDETITRTHASSIGPVLAQVEGSNPLLERIVIHDLYDGQPLKKGDYNVTVRCTYRAADRTLTEDEAKKAHADVMKTLKA